MKRKYIIATVEGKKPSALLGPKGLDLALDTCKRGWPDEKWEIFSVDVIPAANKWDNAVVKLFGHSDTIKTLREELADRLGDGFEVHLNA